MIGAPEIVAALAIGFAAGVASGVLGVGGGILFVPGLVLFLHQTQLDAQATSLLAVILVALVGAGRQRAYGNLHLRDGLLIGALSVPGVALGSVLANKLPERALELLFAAVQIYVAYELVRRLAAARSASASEA